MAQTPSTMLPLGTPCPPFTLTDAVTGRAVSRDAAAAGQPLLVMFICNHCPYVIYVRDEITRLARDYMGRGVAVVAINANSIKTHPQDGPENMQRLARELGWEFPFLFDATQDVARAFAAACTPEFYLFDTSQKLVYRGQLDESRPANRKPPTGRDLRAALDALLAGQPVPSEQVPSVGCNVKWDCAAPA